MLRSAFSGKKEGQDISLQISDLMVNGNTKTSFGVFLITKSMHTFCVSDRLPLVQLKYSLNSFCSKPETNDVSVE